MSYRASFQVMAVALLAAIVLAAPARAAAPPAARAESPRDALEQAQAKMVKVYGVGGVQGLEGYQSGMLISAEGHILTVLSHALDTDYISVTLADGRKFDAKLLGGDPRLDVAVLKIAATGLPHFELNDAVAVQSGTRVLALSNAFGVATGNEPVSVQHGTVSVVTRLDARRGVFESPYHGPVYVLDVVTNNPGVAGGALVTRQGQLVAMLGKELRNTLNNTWLNYAMPIAQLRESTDAIRAGRFVARTEKQPEKKKLHPMDLERLGIVLVPDVLERTPAFVDQVRPGSPAARAGILPDDLVLLVGDHLTQSCRTLRSELALIDRDDRVQLTVLRGPDLTTVTLEPADEERQVSP
jgi:serine protease Do